MYKKGDTMTDKKLLINLLEQNNFKVLQSLNKENKDIVLTTISCSEEQRIRELLSFKGFNYKIRPRNSDLQVIIKMKNL